jgi:hypothetical protein
MNRLFITNLASLEYDSLEKQFPESETIFMSKGYVDLSTPESIKKFYDDVKKKLDSSTPEDYLVLSGASIIGVVLFMFWIQKHGVARIITYNKRLEGYQEVTLTNVGMLPDDRGQSTEGKNND